MAVTPGRSGSSAATTIGTTWEMPTPTVGRPDRQLGVVGGHELETLPVFRLGDRVDEFPDERQVFSLPGRFDGGEGSGSRLVRPVKLLDDYVVYVVGGLTRSDERLDVGNFGFIGGVKE